MRVLDLNNNYSPTGGGVRTYHHAKLDWFENQSDHTAALVIPSNRFEHAVHGKTEIFHVPAMPLGRSGYRFTVTTGSLRRVVRLFRPDLVELGSPYVLPWLLRRVDRKRSIATAGFYHSDVADAVVGPLFGRFGLAAQEVGASAARRWIGGVYAKLDCTMGASEFVLRKLADMGVRRLFHTPLGVDTQAHGPERRSTEFRRSLGVGDGETLVLYLARLSPEKGLPLLFAAWPRLAALGFRLLVVGHGPLERELRAFQASVPNVATLPFMLDRDQVASAYASADVSLSLGAVETFSLSTLEAFVSGTPVAAPHAGGAGELVARLAPELLFEPHSANGLVRAVRAASVMPMAVRLQLAERARRALSWGAVFDRIMGVYERVLAAHRRGALANLDAPLGGWHPAEDYWGGRE